jgi:hypothetical protein
MDEARHTVALGLSKHCLRPLNMNIFKGVSARLADNANQMNDCIHVSQSTCQGIGREDISMVHLASAA